MVFALAGDSTMTRCFFVVSICGADEVLVVLRVDLPDDGFDLVPVDDFLGMIQKKSKTVSVYRNLCNDCNQG